MSGMDASELRIGDRHTEAKENCILQPAFTRMDREQMKIAIMEQEQAFRQQVNELHRVYHVQEQLTREMQAAMVNQAHAETRKPQLNLLPSGENAAAEHQQFYSAPNSSTPAAIEDCNLELTLATGSTSSSRSRSQKGKQVMIRSPNSDSGTAVSSTSTDSELAQLKEFDVTAPARFQSASMRRGDEMNQSPPWIHQCMSLRMARQNSTRTDDSVSIHSLQSMTSFLFRATSRIEGHQESIYNRKFSAD